MTNSAPAGDNQENEKQNCKKRKKCFHLRIYLAESVGNENEKTLLPLTGFVRSDSDFRHLRWSEAFRQKWVSFSGYSLNLHRSNLFLIFKEHHVGDDHQSGHRRGYQPNILPQMSCAPG